MIVAILIVLLIIAGAVIFGLAARYHRARRRAIVWETSLEALHKSLCAQANQARGRRAAARAITKLVGDERCHEVEAFALAADLAGDAVDMAKANL